MDRMSNFTPGRALASSYMHCQLIRMNVRELLTINRIDSAVRHGTVDFSTTILLVVDTSAIIRTACSRSFRSWAAPRPTPSHLVGVLTLTKINSASSMAFSIFVEKKRFGVRVASWPSIAHVSVNICYYARNCSDFELTKVR